MQQVLRNATVIDGTNRPRYVADVAISDGVIEQVGDVEVEEGAEEFDLSGLVLAPGFIDVHTHYDAQIFWDPDLTPSSWHGVTTVVMTNCGFGLAPVREDDHDLLIRTFERVEGMPAQVLRAGIPWGFESFTEYFDVLEGLPKRLNVGVFVGHTPIRYYVMGPEAQERQATEAEVEAMCAIAEEALRRGALGFATSVRPTATGAGGRPIPSVLAGNEELEALGGVLGTVGRGIYYAIHGPGKDEFWIDEFAEMSRRSGRPFVWAPLLTGEYGGRGKTLELMEWALRHGDAEIWAEVSSLPTTNQFTFMRAGILSARHPALKELDPMPVEEKIRRMRDPEWRAKAKHEIETEPRSKDIWNRMSVAETSRHHEFKGLPLAEVGRRTSTDPFDVLIDFSIEEELATRFDVHINNDDEVELADLLKHPKAILALSDAGAHPSEQCDAAWPTHVLGYWCREQGVLSLETAVWKLSGQPAAAFRLEDRGTIEPGKAADLVAFDPDVVARNENERVWDLPTGADRLIATSEGIEHIWINGARSRVDGKDVPDVTTGTIVRGLGPDPDGSPLSSAK